VSLLAERGGTTLKRSKEKSLSAEVTIAGKHVVLAFPQTYMNLSGEAVAKLVRRHSIDDPRQIVIVHDELDLPVGRMRVKVGGGLAGHNGLKSIVQHLKTDDFVRVRMGVGKPQSAQQGADHVLKKPSKKDRTEFDVVVQEAADAVETIVGEGAEVAMNRYNG
jgi:peptidyl-tRNA hydrolase, PTH1 family